MSRGRTDFLLRKKSTRFTLMTKLCIDGMNLSLTQGTGIRTYAQNLLSNAAAADISTQVLFGADIPHSANPTERAAILADPHSPARSRTKTDRLIRRVTRIKTRWGRSAQIAFSSDKIIWPNANLPPAPVVWHASNIFSDANRHFRNTGKLAKIRFDSESSKPDIVHWTTPIPICCDQSINICTLHDIIPLKVPYTTNHDRIVFSQLCRRVFDRADKIISISETSKLDAVELLGIPDDKITVIHQSVSPPETVINRPIKSLHRDIEEQFALEPYQYFLYFGAIEPKKNLLRTLEAALTSESRLVLVVVGHRGWSNDAEHYFLSLLANHRTNRIRHLDYLSETQLASLVRCARATVFPSIYEGFGLPALESLILGTPVLASATPALMEVCGEAACYANPLDVSSIRDAFTRLSRDTAYCEELRAAGLAQAKKFSPEKYRQRLRNFYTSVL